VPVRSASALRSQRRVTWRRVGLGQVVERGQAIVETALVLPLLLFLAFGVVGVQRVLHAQTGVSAVAREAARVAALAGNPAQARETGEDRAQSVATGYGLTNGSLRVSLNPGAFARGGEVQVEVQYSASLDDLPLLGWVHVPVSSRHVERIDPYRSRWSGGR